MPSEASSSSGANVATGSSGGGGGSTGLGGGSGGSAANDGGEGTSASNSEQIPPHRRQLGERLYPKVHSMQPVSSLVFNPKQLIF